MENKEMVWAVFHINNKFEDSIEEELKKFGYHNVKVYIPKVSVLKRRSKGQDIYEEVPMLFSYGFMRIPREAAFSREYLFKMKKKISGVLSWVKTTETMHKRKLKKRVDNPEDWDDFSIVAIVDRAEVRNLKRIAKKNKVYSKYDIAQLALGSYIILRGYPFDGIEAIVMEISLVQKQVKVKLFPNGGVIEVWLPFDNVLYSVYTDYDPNKLTWFHAEDKISNSYKLTTEQEEYECSR